jgi:hypothetical protein
VNDLQLLKFWEELALQLASLWKTFWHAIKSIFCEVVHDGWYYSYQNNTPEVAPPRFRLSSTQAEFYRQTIPQTISNKKLLNINNGGELIKHSIDYPNINNIKIRRVGGIVDAVSKIARVRGNVAPHYNKKTFRRYNYWWYTIQYIIGYLNINKMRLRLVGGGIGALNNCSRQSSHRAITIKHVADIIIDDSLFNTVAITQKSLWRGHGESAALLARSQRLLVNQCCRRYIDKTFRRHNYWLYTIQYSSDYPKINMATLRRVGGVVGAVSKIARQPMLSPLHRQNVSPT